MMIFWRHGLAFLSIPKTATHAFQALYGDEADILFRHPQQLKHMGLQRFNARVRPLLPDGGRLETMALIREPMDWLGSWYRYRTRTAIADRPTSTAKLGFDAFVEAYLHDSPPDFAAVGTQRGLLVDRNGATVTHLFAYEATDRITAFLDERLGTPGRTLPRRNVSPEMPLSLPDDLRRRAEAKLAEDYALYAQAIGRP